MLKNKTEKIVNHNDNDNQYHCNHHNHNDILK